MTNNEIISALGQESFVEGLVKKYISASSSAAYSVGDYSHDLSQDIYISLLGMDNKTLNRMYATSEIEFYIRRIVKNNIFVKTSNFFKKYLQNEKTVRLQLIKQDFYDTEQESPDPARLQHLCHP